MFANSRWKAGLSHFLKFGPSVDRYDGLTVYRHRGRVDVDLQSAEVTHHVLRQLKPERHPTVVAKLRSAFGAVVLIVADGAHWEKTHKSIAPFFTPAYTRQHYLPTIHAMATQTFAALRERIIAAGGDAVVIDVEDRMRHITSRVMGYVLFGAALTPQEADHVHNLMDVTMQTLEGWTTTHVNRWIGAMLDLFNKQHYQPVLFPVRQHRAVKALLAWIVAKLESTEQQNADASPVLAALRTRFAGNSPGATTRLIAAEYAMMFIAGIETTAAAATFTLSEIANDKTILERVVAEATRDGADPNGAMPDPHRFPYIHQVFQEALRRSTIVPTILRRSARPDTVSGAAIPAHATYRALVSRFHRKADVWARPGQFDPDRFSAPLSAEQKANYMPFGSGPNVCMGREIASAEAILTIAAFFQHLEIEHGTLQRVARKDTWRTAIDTIRPKHVTAGVRARATFAG
jgi:cytochrome P450